MSDTLSRNDPGEGERPAAPDTLAPELTAQRSGQAQPSGDEQPPGRAQPSRKRGRGRRAAVIAAIAVVAAGGVAAAVTAGLATGSKPGVALRRVQVAGLAAAGVPAAMTTAGGGTILVVGAQGSHGKAATADERDPSGLIMLFHINSGGRGGAVVSLPATAEVTPPGMGRTELANVLTRGGRSLLVQTVGRLTGVSISHYAVIDFARIAPLVGAIGGVDVTVPKAAASGHAAFHAGVNHLTGTAAAAYVRAASVTPQERVLREQSLIRAIMTKIARRHLLAHPAAGGPALAALAGALTVDSGFTTADLQFLASHLRVLGGPSGPFVTPPSYVVNGQRYLDPAGSSALWQAVNADSVASFAARYPSTLTPAVSP